MPEAEQGLNVARIGVLLAGLPDTVGGVTVNRFCASGLTAVAMAADRIRVGEADLMIAGGTESMSMVPMMGNKPAMNPTDLRRQREHRDRLRHGPHGREGRAAVEGFARGPGRLRLQSHQRAIAGQQAGEFADETVAGRVHRAPPDLAGGKVVVRERRVEADEGAREDTTVEILAKLRPVFAARGSVTAGNSSQTSDGAGALIVASERALKQFDLKPLARFVSFAVRGVPPQIMGIGPKEAIPAALARAGLGRDDLDWIELNEAFAAQSLAVIRDLGLDPAKVNPIGGAIALGHPLGATGAIRVGDRGARAAAHGAALRHGDDVRRHRHGRRRHLRAPLTSWDHGRPGQQRAISARHLRPRHTARKRGLQASCFPPSAGCVLIRLSMLEFLPSGTPRPAAPIAGDEVRTMNGTLRRIGTVSLLAAAALAGGCAVYATPADVGVAVAPPPVTSDLRSWSGPTATGGAMLRLSRLLSPAVLSAALRAAAALLPPLSRAVPLAARRPAISARLATLPRDWRRSLPVSLLTVPIGFPSSVAALWLPRPGRRAPVPST